MDRFRYDFDQAQRQIDQVHRLHENARESLDEMKRAWGLLNPGDGDNVRRLMEGLEARILQTRRLCQRLEELESALRVNLRRFEEMEMELAERPRRLGVEAIGGLQPMPPVPYTPFAPSSPPVFSGGGQVAQLRFSDVFYPGFLSEAAEHYFASAR